MRADRLRTAGRILLPGVVFCAVSALLSAPAPTFETAVQPVLTSTCSACHKAKLASGGLNILAYSVPSSIKDHPAEWDVILRKIRAGEMPPKGITRPSQDKIDALIQYVQTALDRSVIADPGRVTAHRLNRSEYANT